MFKLVAVNVVRVRGNRECITSEEEITGGLELVVYPNGRADIMLPVDVFVEANAERRKMGLSEYKTLDRLDIYLRCVLSLSKSEVSKLLSIEPGAIFKVRRKGWNREWSHTIRKILD